MNKFLYINLVILSLIIFNGCSNQEANNPINDIIEHNLTISENISIKENKTLENNLSLELEEINQTIIKNEEIKKIKLLPIKDKIYFGAFPDFGGPEDNVTKSRIIDFENLINKNITWAYFSQNWFNGIKYPKKEIHTINDEGIIPFVRLMPRSDEEQFHKENNFNLDNIIKGKFDNELRQWAKNSKEDNIPLLVDFAVEMNGDWFSWSGFYNGANTKDKYGDKNYYDGPEKYRDAYRHIIDIFREENVTHITWFFHADIYSNPEFEWNQPKYYYPGDDYIDWIGFSIYGPQNPDEDYWETFSEIIEDRHNSIEEISKNKPLAVLEFGVTDNHPLGDKADWLEDAFKIILDNKYLKFNAISYWNENWEERDNLFATIRVDSSEKSLKTFKELSQNKKFISNGNFSNSNLVENNIINEENISKLLFKSGFENGVYIDDNLLEYSEDYRIIRGGDVLDFSWPINIFGAKDSGLHYIGDDNQKAIYSKIETTIGHDGNKTRALYQQENYETEDCTQCPYEILDIINGTNDLYIRHWIKIDSESITKKDEDLWRTFFEYKTKDYAKGSGFRLISFINTEEDGMPYWSFQGDKDPENPIWKIDNKKVPVPLDEWFLTEFYWHWSEDNSGRALWKINGEVIGDHYGPTTRNSKPIDFIMLFQIYGNSNPKHQWIDDIEIWDSIPEKYKDITNNKDSWFKPKPKASWQWQLTGDIDTSYDVDIYDIDLFETSQSTIDKLHKKSKKVICYISAGSWEDWRPDANDFPLSIIGRNYDGWQGEKWLDISNYETFAKVLTARLDLAVEKKCDGIEPDNIQGYQENTGFSLTYEDQIKFNIWLANEAHKRGLSIALKNDGEQVKDLIDYYDLAIVEECFEWDECNPYSEFIKHDKAVLGVEYNLQLNDFCSKANNLNFSWLKMDYNLDGGRKSCEDN